MVLVVLLAQYKVSCHAGRSSKSRGEVNREMESPANDPILTGLAAGDLRAFEVLYDRYAVRLYRVARGLLDHPHDAEDAVQEVFVSLVRSRELFNRVRDLDAYLFSSLRRAAGRVAKKKTSWPRSADSDVLDSSIDSKPPPGDFQSDELENLLKKLPAAQREVILLKTDAGLTFEQIGDVMGTSTHTAASRYRYGLEKLRTEIHKNERN